MLRNENPLAALRPTDPRMAAAWASAVSAASVTEPLMRQFRADTGCAWKPGRTGLDRMIDEATGADKDFVIQFVKWFNRVVWGEDSTGRATNGGEV